MVGMMSMTVANEVSILPSRDDVKAGYLKINGTRIPPSDEKHLYKREGAVAADAHRGPYQT